MRRGFAPSRIPTAGTTFPLDTLLQRFAFSFFPRRDLFYSELHVTREFTVVAGPVSGKLYVEINAIDMQYTSM